MLCSITPCERPDSWPLLLPALGCVLDFEARTWWDLDSVLSERVWDCCGRP